VSSSQKAVDRAAGIAACSKPPVIRARLQPVALSATKPNVFSPVLHIPRKARQFSSRMNPI